MKTNIPSLRLLSATLLAFALAGPTLRAADENTTASVKLSAPDKPATFSVEVPWADIHIVGVDGDTVTVESSITQKSAKPAKPGALRRLDDEVTFELVEKDNTVTLSLGGDSPWAGHDAEFKVSVPRAMALKLRTDTGGDLAVKNIDGDIDVTSMNGDIVLDGISGGAVVSTMNGEVRVNYPKVPQKAVSITSMNGEISLRVPADTKANISMRNHNGSILTDFSEDVLKTKTENSRHSGSSYSNSYNYSYGSDAKAREIARAAMEASRDAVRAAADATREVARATARAIKEESDSDSDGVPPVPPIAPRAPRAPRAPIATITGGKLVSGTLNGGGVDIKLSSMNGEITLRQSK